MFRPVSLTQRLLVLLLCIACCNTGYGQQSSPYYRFQYHHYRWQAFHTEAFHIYFPQGYDSACAFIAERLPGAMALIRKRMATGLQQQPNIIIYPSADQLYESNIGGADPGPVTLPTFVIKGARTILAYNGSYSDLELQLRKALVQATWTTQLNEGLEAQARGTVSRDALPYWMRAGMQQYFAEGWPVEREDALLRLLRERRPPDWEAFTALQPALAGQALCYYLAGSYYPEAPVQLYFLFRKRKPLPRAIRLIAKTEADSVYAACLQFYQARDTWNRQALPADTVTGKMTFTVPRKKGRPVAWLADERGTMIAYTVATWHKRSLYLYDLQAKKTTFIADYKLPPWLNEHSADPYPLLAWTAAGGLLVAKPVSGRIVLTLYDRTGNRRAAYPLEGIDGISKVAAGKEREVVLAAWRRAQSDIVRYQLQQDKYTPCTMDAWDDAAPAWNSAGLVFTSSRPLTAEKKDTVLYHGLFRYQDKAVVPLQADTIGYKQWRQPILLNDGRVLAVTTQNGFEQFALIPGQSHAAKSMQLLAGVQPVQYLPGTNEMLSYREGTDSFFFRQEPLQDWIDRQQWNDSSSRTPWLTDYHNAAAMRAKEDSLLKAAADPTPSFLDGMLSRGNTREKAAARRDSLRAALQYRPSKSSPYILQLYSAYFSAKINNDYFINRYQPYAAYQGTFKFPATGGLAQGGFSDLFENHHFTIAYRLPAGSDGSDFFVKYRNTSRRLDWSLAYFRKVEDLKPDPLRYWVDENGRPYPNTAKAKTNYAELGLQYPLTYYSGLSVLLALRHDKTYFPATEKYSLDFPAVKSLWSILTLSYSLRRLQPTLPLLSKGFTLHVTADGFKSFTQSQEALGGGSFRVAYHLPLYRYITLVTQLSAGGSVGGHKILYNLGGVDNNITPRVDSNVHLPQAAPYAFQTLVTPLRGYFQNSSYGSSYALLNADIYFPLFQSLVPVETPVSAINNLQPGLFLDVMKTGGSRSFTTAAQGWQTAYGFSARTTLAGYPLRFDMGWPGSFARKPVWYLSLNLMQ